MYIITTIPYVGLYRCIFSPHSCEGLGHGSRPDWGEGRGPFKWGPPSRPTGSSADRSTNLAGPAFPAAHWPGGAEVPPSGAASQWEESWARVGAKLVRVADGRRAAGQCRGLGAGPGRPSGSGGCGERGSGRPPRVRGPGPSGAERGGPAGVGFVRLCPR